MATLPPVPTVPPPELHDGRDPYSPVGIKLINWLRRRVAASAAAGFAIFSTAVGRGDILSDSSGNEIVGLNFELPAVYPTFTINFSGEGKDAGGLGTYRVRMGGTYGAADGTIIATMTAGSTSFVRCAVSNSVTGNAETLLKVTYQSSGAGHVVQLKGAFVIGSN